MSRDNDGPLIPAPSWFDRALLNISPGWAASRARARFNYIQNRAAETFISRKYDGAGSGSRNEGWSRPATSANAEVRAGAATTRNGARELVRNNGHATNALAVLKNNVIGTGIRVGFDSNSSATERALRELWEQHMESKDSGAEDGGNFYQRQGLAFRAICESGSVLLRRRRRRVSSLKLPFQVQLLEPDFLDTSRDGFLASNTYAGKEYNDQGDFTAAWLYTSHPGDSYSGFGQYKSVRVAASELSHAFRIDRPGQTDGVTWFAPIMTDLRDIADTRDAYQLRQKIAACFTVFVHETSGIPGTGTPDKGQPINDTIYPGRVESLPPGKQVTFADPPGVDGLSDFDRAQLLTIAAGIGIPYEALTGDLSNVNFLSGRMGWLAFYRNIDGWRTDIVIPRICEPEMKWFLEAAAVARGIAEPVRVNWTAPHRDLLDPTKEIKALREEMRLGTLSYPDLVRMRGRDPQSVVDSWQKWDKELADRKLFFDWDPRKFSLAGNLSDTTGGN